MEYKNKFKSICQGLLGLGIAALSTSAWAADPVKLLVWSDPVRLPIYKAYDEARDNVELEIVTLAHKDVVSKLQLAMRAKAGIPDVVWMGDVNTAAQISTRRANYLMDITDKVDPKLLEGFYPSSNAPCYIDGKLKCLRNDVAHFVLWYNKPLMEKLGLSVPTTWEEYEATALKAAALGTGIISGSGGENTPLINFLMSNNCDLVVPGKEGNTLIINAVAPACVKAAQMVDRLLAGGALSPLTPFDANFVKTAKEGKLLMTPGPTWFGEHVIKRRYEFKKGTLAVALPPKWADQKVPVTWSWGGGVWGGWKDTKHADAVVDLLQFVTTDFGVAENAVTMPAYQPASVPWGKKLVNSGYYADDKVFSVQLEAAKFGHPGYISLRFSTRSAFTKAVLGDMANGASLESMLPALQAEFVNSAKLAGYKVIEN